MEIEMIGEIFLPPMLFVEFSFEVFFEVQMPSVSRYSSKLCELNPKFSNFLPIFKAVDAALELSSDAFR